MRGEGAVKEGSRERGSGKAVQSDHPLPTG